MSIKESTAKKNYSNKSDKNKKVADASYKKDILSLVNKVRKRYGMKKNTGTFVVDDRGGGIKIVVTKD